MNNIIIKYDLQSDFIVGNFYQLKFLFDKTSQITSLENNHEDCEKFLKDIDNQVVTMCYKGISKIDNKKVFLLNSTLISRELKLKELGI